MKKLFTVFSAVLLAATIWAQTPQKMSYQAVVRDDNSSLIVEQPVGIKISILQGSESGTEVYTETQTPTTNANGLVSIEIGGGAGFDAIDWANSTFFIKTEIDPTGGTNYTISGTSQLLSVPYALHAKSAESITGTITETDPVFKAWTKDYNDLTNKPDLLEYEYAIQNNIVRIEMLQADGAYMQQNFAQLNAEVNALKSQVTMLQTQVTELQTQVTELQNQMEQSTLTIGQSYQGGIIFWLDETEQHGLIAATSDQSAGMQWYNGTNTTTNAVRDGIGAGMYNTERIIANQGPGSYAAQLCANYQGGGYSGWYLPSEYELNLLYKQKSIVGGFANDWYASSKETYDSDSSVQNFGTGAVGNRVKYGPSYVRAIRAF